MSSLLGFFASLVALSSFTFSHPLPKRDLFLPVPHDDPFYDAPDNLGSLKNGEIYNHRSIFPPQFAATAQSVEQVAYGTIDTQGNASHTVATVFSPYNPDPNPKLFSIQVWEDSINIDCSPSYSLFGGMATPDGITTQDSAIFIDWALAQGYYVVAADHEGPKSSFFAGFTEGYAGIDGVRAALSQLSLPSDTPVVLYGYSGGAHATVWMTDLVGTHAPELNIVGAAHGGTPVDPKGNVEFLDGKQFSGFVLGAIGGLSSAYPELKDQLWPYGNQHLKNALETMWSDNTCILTEILTLGDATYHEMTSLPDFFAFKPVADVLANESLLTNVSSHSVSVPKFPRYIFHAVNDEVIPYNLLNQYVSQQCGNGANIQFVNWPGGDHVSMAVAGIPNSLQFVEQAFNGKTPNVSCGTSAHDVLTMTTEGVGSIIGQGIYDAIAALDGVVTPLGKIVLNLG